MKQVPGRTGGGFVTLNSTRPYWWKICHVKQVPGRTGGRFVTFDKYQDRSRVGFVVLNRPKIILGQALRRGTGPGSFWDGIREDL